MRRYFFDVRDGDGLLMDEEGSQFGSLEAVQQEAALSLADLARDTLRRRYMHQLQHFAIEVRDEEGPVLHAKFAFEFDRRLASNRPGDPMAKLDVLPISNSGLALP